jgi:hypothetical protein
MTTVEFLTVTVSCISIGASLVSVLLFVLYAMLQRRLLLIEDDPRLPEDITSLIGLLGASFRDDVPDDHRRVLQAVVRRYAETTLTSVLDDPIEKSYLFQALTDPERLPWESEHAATSEDTATSEDAATSAHAVTSEDVATSEDIQRASPSVSVGPGSKGIHRRLPR